MAAFFVAASSQRLVNSAPSVLGYPFSVGVWTTLTAVGVVNRTLFALGDTATPDHYFRLRMSASEVLGVGVSAGGTESIGAVATAMDAGKWVFVIGRFISATSRRITVLHANGLVQSGSASASVAPAGIDTMALGALVTSDGATELWDGSIAEFWLANSDVQADGAAATQDRLARQLAYGGPFSVPHIAKDIVEYRSLRKHPLVGDVEDIFFGAKGAQNWTNTNGVTTGPHPPLPYWYVKPGQTKRALVI